MANNVRSTIFLSALDIVPMNRACGGSYHHLFKGVF